MPNRESLHELIDTLPEAAFEVAGRVLQNYQTWPPKPPIGVEKMHERVDELLERRGEELAAAHNRTGYVSVHMRGGSFKPDGDGMASASTMDGRDLVNFEIRIFCGHRLVIMDEPTQVRSVVPWKIKRPTSISRCADYAVSRWRLTAQSRKRKESRSYA
jgi:hypothetical protein